MTHVAAKELGCVLNSLLDEEHDADWLRESYEDIQIRRIKQHIRFADYWYTANDHFTELKEFTREIAKDAGLDLDADEAFQWLGTGGFVNDDWRAARVATFSLGSTKELTQFLGEGKSEWLINGGTHFRFVPADAEKVEIPAYHQGKVLKREAYVRDNKTLPLVGAFGNLAKFLETTKNAADLSEFLRLIGKNDAALTNAIEALESMAFEGWVRVKKLSGVPAFEVSSPAESEHLHYNRDQNTVP